MSSPWTFFSAGPSPPGPKPSPDGAFEAPTRHDRKKCWEARDSFFRCLDQHGIIDSIKDFAQADKQCGSQEMDLRKECATSWVTYFKQRRVMEHKKKSMLEGLANEGATALPQGTPLLRPGAGK